jgi:hypothetical protein
VVPGRRYHRRRRQEQHRQHSRRHPHCFPGTSDTAGAALQANAVAMHN